MRPNNHAFNHKLFHILAMPKYKVIQTCRLQNGRSRLVRSDSSVYRASARRLNHMHRSLSFDFSFSPRVPLLSTICLLIYNLLLLFIGNLKIATTWADWLAIKDCNNYLPNNLASEINLTILQSQIVDFSFLSDWHTISWLVQTLTESAGSQVQICK